MPIYYATNEDLDTIIHGLAPRAGDSILAICGSGDQAFALAQQGARVTAIDISLEQLHFAHTRYNALMVGDMNTFFNPDPYQYKIMERTKRDVLSQKRKNYFNNFKLKNEMNISFMHGDLLDEVVRRDYNKVYLSNIFSCVSNRPIVQRFVKDNKDSSALFYDTTAWRTWHVLEPNGVWKHERQVFEVGGLHVLHCYFDIKSATRAYLKNEVQNWTPAVYTFGSNKG